MENCPNPIHAFPSNAGRRNLGDHSSAAEEVELTAHAC